MASVTPSVVGGWLWPSWCRSDGVDGHVAQDRALQRRTVVVESGVLGRIHARGPWITLRTFAGEWIRFVKTRVLWRQSFRVPIECLRAHGRHRHHRTRPGYVANPEPGARHQW